MSKTLNVLYQTGEFYAPFTGISILSLLRNNREEGLVINVYVIDDGIAPEDRGKMERLVDEYKQRLHFLDMSFAGQLLEQYKATVWRGNCGPYFKLFAFDILGDDVKRILYIDGDTIITGSLVELMDIDMRGNIVAMTEEFDNADYFETALGFSKTDPYFNAGIMLVDVDAWKTEKVRDAMLQRLENRSYMAADQGLLNVTLHGRIMPLHEKFNSYPYYGRKTNAFFEAEADPRIRHYIKFLGERPWDKNSRHPFTRVFDQYMAMSPWKDMQKKEPPRRLSFRIGKILYALLPKSLFFRIGLFAKSCGIKKKFPKIT
jgi:lipopolysaccharide biosynthesis glycosyltransferase